MKKICTLLLLLVLIGSTNAMAQDAKSILERYYKVTGLDKVTPSEQSLMIDMSMLMNNMEVPANIISDGPNKMRIEIVAMGQKMLMIINGEKGWAVVPGAGKQPLPQEAINQTKNQNDILSNMTWDLTKVDIKLLDDKEEGAKKYDVVEVKTKDTKTPGSTQVLYIDKSTGLIDYVEGKVENEGKMVEFTTRFADYKDFSGVKIPTKMTVEANGQVVSTVKINKFELEYPVADWMFAEPE